MTVADQRAQQQQREERALIERHIAPDPAGRGAAHARLSKYGTPVWALIGYLDGDAGGVERVAADYAVPVEAVRAALAYYARHKALIDAKLLLNAAPERRRPAAVVDFYLDEDIPVALVAELRRLGHSAVHGAAPHRGATDDVQFLEAVRRRRVLVTSNREDFLLLHHAWTHWTHAWAADRAEAETQGRRTPHPGPAPVSGPSVWTVPHPGVLVVPNDPRWRAPRLADLLDGFFRTVPPLPIAGRLYRWVEAPGPGPGRWRELPPSPR